MPGYDTNVGAKRAREARRALGLHPAQPIPCLLTAVEERAQIPVLLLPMGEGVAGCFWHEGGRRLIHVNAHQALVRQRFTLAHELGHAWCAHDGDLVIDDAETISGRSTDPFEVQANAFAAELLVPRQALAEVLEGEPNLDELVTIACFYGVSAISVLYRCRTCSLVGEERARRLEAEIEDGQHLRRLEDLGIEELRDRLAALHDGPPYLSPAIRGSALGADLGLA